MTWAWTDAAGPARLRDELCGAGIAQFSTNDLVEEARRSPWACAQRLFAERPLLVEMQPIRPIPGGRSFSSGSTAAPFHTDSQCLLGVPPSVQVMLCIRPAARGGESLYLDTWPLLTAVEQAEPALFTRLFDELRRLPFVFGDFFGPTVSWRRGHLVFSHSPHIADDIGRRLEPHLGRAQVIERRAEASDAIAINNQRLLHGRRAFDDDAREFVRLLVWLREPFRAPPAYAAAARDEAKQLDARLAQAPEALRARLGVVSEERPAASQRLDVVLQLLRGTPAGVLSAREHVPEAEIYGWRDAVISAGVSALEADPLGHDALEAFWRELSAPRSKA